MATALQSRGGVRSALPDACVLDEAEVAPRLRVAEIRVLAFVEARGVTGPLRNLLDFAHRAATLSPRISFEIATYWRSSAPGLPGRGTEDIQQAIEACRDRGLTVHVLHERRAGDRRLLRQVAALVEARTPDVVETHHVKSHFLVAASGAARARPWLAVHHGYTTTTLRTRACNFLDRWSLGRAPAVLTPCRAFAGELAANAIPRERIAVVHNAVAAPPVVRTEIDEFRRRHDLPQNARVVLTVGRLSREKAQADLLAALAAEPLRSATDVYLVVAGDGADRQRLERLARTLRIDERVRFTGHLRNVWPSYHAADVFALPSATEGSPNALLEAMAAGLPVVATRVGGVPEIVTDRLTGILVPASDPAALSIAIRSVLSDRSRAAALGERGQALVRQKFSPDARTASLAALYSRVIRRWTS